MTLSLYTAESLKLRFLIHFNGQKGSKEPTISRDFKGFMGVEKLWLLSDRDLNMIIVFFMRKHERKNKAAGRTATAVFFQITRLSLSRHSHYLRDWNRLSRMVKIYLY